jgi:hypothetical protein
MLRQTLLAFLLVVSLPVYSERIVITGKPVTLQLHPGYFTFPETYTDRNLGYYFVTISGTNRVCYLAKQPRLSKLDTIQIVIEKNELQLPWTCYQYNRLYFEGDY